MTSIMHRSFAEYMGINWPKEIACFVNEKAVTFAQLRAEQKERQSKRLQDIQRSFEPVHQAAFIWVFFVPGAIYGGWHLYVWTLKHSWWLKRPEGVALDIMRAFPAGVLPAPENFYQWKAAFAKQYSRPGRFKKQGLIPVWIECVYDGGFPCRLHTEPARKKEAAA
jgi:hypothetical protein